MISRLLLKSTGFHLSQLDRIPQDKLPLPKPRFLHAQQVSSRRVPVSVKLLPICSITTSHLQIRPSQLAHAFGQDIRAPLTSADLARFLHEHRRLCKSMQMNESEREAHRPVMEMVSICDAALMRNAEVLSVGGCACDVCPAPVAAAAL